MMDIINEVREKTRFITNKLDSINEKIKLSISKLSIKIKNSINEFIYQNSYENKIRFDKKTIFLKSKYLIVRNKEETNVINKKTDANVTNNKENLLKEKWKILNNIELPNGDLIPIDKAINNIHLSKQDSILKSKLSLIDYITDIQFKSSVNNSMNSSNLDNKNKSDYVEFGGYENVSNLKSNNMNDGYLIMTKPKSTSENMGDKFNPNVIKNEILSEKEDFKSFLLEITKNISLLDRLSDGENSYGYVFLAKVVNYLENYNKNKESGKTDLINKETYFKKLTNSDYFFKLNKRINNIIYLQYLKEEQGAYENGIIEKINIIANNTLNESEKLKEGEIKKEVFSAHERLNKDNMLIIEKQHKDKLILINNDNSFDEVLAEIDNQLNIANENKNLTLKELLEKVKK
ncbi:hypothetical protein [Proteus penneri]|uniref:Uncharacterized protein n=1 Tax=Proteus penneri TaxID=102862 RepID=A0A0G4Q7U2_9GAMM|nr:hypothetical protein [Proteus penneri]CRL61684.1 hypothetical protein BN1804_01593 [Proteus penneri]